MADAGLLSTSSETAVERLTRGGRSMERVSDAGALRRRIAAWQAAGERIALVPTMGALHDGHLSLVRRARLHADRVVVSVFVNPLQFGPGEDFELYPRDLDGDARKLEDEGCDLVFEPTVDTMVPTGHSTCVDVEGPSTGFEADARPGHFRGVATIVTQLFCLVTPDVAVFGEKDAQQLAVVRKLVRDLQFGIEIVPGPIVRDSDGLAMSSRNVYLSAAQRVAARTLSRSLEAARRHIEGGERAAAAIRDVVLGELARAENDGIDYVAVVDARSFRPVDRVGDEVVVALAVRFGGTRLLDNARFELPFGPDPT